MVVGLPQDEIDRRVARDNWCPETAPEDTVLVSRRGSLGTTTCHHESEDCPRLGTIRNVEHLSRDEAQFRGFAPCLFCAPFLRTPTPGGATTAPSSHFEALLQADSWDDLRQTNPDP